MNILLMADVLPNPDSGAAGTEYQTVHALRELGHTVDTVWADELPHRVGHPNLHYLFELPLAYRRVMLSRLGKARYDIVHVNQPHGYLAAQALDGKYPETAFIHRSHGFEPHVERELSKWRGLFPDEAFGGASFMRRKARQAMAAALRRSSGAIARHAHGHIVSASGCADYLATELGVPDRRIAVIAQAAPPRYVATPAAPMGGERLRRVLAVGQYAFFKAPMITAQAMNLIAERRPGIEFSWVAQASHHGKILGLLSQAVRERIVLHDWMPQERLIDLYDRHGVFLFPSFVEGFGKVFLEAMARGMCVVAADNGGAHDIIRHGADGMRVPTGSADALASASLSLLDSPDLASAVSAGAAAKARQYTWERVAAETAAFYRRCLADRANPL